MPVGHSELVPTLARRIRVGIAKTYNIYEAGEPDILPVLSTVPVDLV